MRTTRLILWTMLTTGALASSSFAFDNVRGRDYLLTPRHGPWLIMVTSFRDVRDPELRRPGMTAEQAAAELVYELRDKGIPAYTYSQQAEKDEVQTRDRFGQLQQRSYVARHDMICVLAGNYDSIDDPIGQTTLRFVKEFSPKFLNDSRNGAVMRTDSHQRGPLAGAFLTINPVLDPKDVAEKSVDLDTKKWNAHSKFSLLKNPHKYTVQIATFQGRSMVVPIGKDNFLKSDLKFGSRISHQDDGGLNPAGENAEQLTVFLRTRGARDSNEGAINEAYVFHSKFESIVTIGGFDSPDDPQIALITKYFEAKFVPDRNSISAERRSQPEPLTEEELTGLPKTLVAHTEQQYSNLLHRRAVLAWFWAFDITPKVIPVPQIK